MCWCTPSLRTPCCGKPECKPPDKKQRLGEVDISIELLQEFLKLPLNRYKIHKVFQRPEDYNYFSIIIEYYTKGLSEINECEKIPKASIEYEKIFTKVVEC